MEAQSIANQRVIDGLRVEVPFKDAASGDFISGNNLGSWTGDGTALASHLGSYQLIPFQRLGETFAELFDCPISPGNLVKKGGEKAAAAMAPIREALVESPVLHTDEWSGAT